MKKIFIRSPYFIEVDEAGQTGAKIEIFLWNKGTTEPIIPNYTLTKNIASASQTLISWNVANYAKEYIEPIAPVTVSVPTEENVNTWCYMKIKTYKLVTSTETLLNTETFVCLNGYNAYSAGYNYSNSNSVVPLANGAITFQKSAAVTPYVNVFYEQGDYEVIDYGTLTVAEGTMYKLPLTEDLNGDDYFEYNSIEVCEPKYTPITCTFINRYGGSRGEFDEVEGVKSELSIEEYLVDLREDNINSINAELSNYCNAACPMCSRFNFKLYTI